MIPYGKNKKIRRNLQDNHPKKGYVNWWEAELGCVNKGSERQEVKRGLKNEINNENY